MCGTCGNMNNTNPCCKKKRFNGEVDVRLVPGESAYEIWLGEGNTGTEQDFLDSLVGQDGQDGSGSKINFYRDSDVATNASGGAYLIDYFLPAPYSDFSFTNTTNLTKDFLVTVNYDMENTQGNIAINLAGAIYTIKSGVETQVRKSLNGVASVFSLYDGPTAQDLVSLGNGDPYEVRSQIAGFNATVTIIKKVTLDPGETAEPRWTTKGNDLTIRQAQIFIQEL